MSDLSFHIRIPDRVCRDWKTSTKAGDQSAQTFHWLGGITSAMALAWTALAFVLFCLIPARVRITSVTGNQGPVGYFTQEQWVTISGKISDLHANHVFLDLNGAVRQVAVEAGEFQSKVSLIPGINRIVVYLSAHRFRCLRSIISKYDPHRAMELLVDGRSRQAYAEGPEVGHETDRLGLVGELTFVTPNPEGTQASHIRR